MGKRVAPIFRCRHRADLKIENSYSARKPNTYPFLCDLPTVDRKRWTRNRLELASAVCGRLLSRNELFPLSHECGRTPGLAENAQQTRAYRYGVETGSGLIGLEWL